MTKILFHLNKIYVQCIVFAFSMIKPWKKIQGVFLPVLLKTGYDTNRWIINNQYECGEMNIIKMKLQKEDIIFEIGTGLGFIASYCAKMVGDSRVFTYEANANSKQLILAIFKKNKVNPSFKIAYLTNNEGINSFPVNSKKILSSSEFIATDHMLSIHKLNINNEIKKVNPTFLIMDIEGGEYDIFSMISFHTIKKIQFELHPQILERDKCDHIFLTLKANGFILDKTVSKGNNYYFFK